MSAADQFTDAMSLAAINALRSADGKSPLASLDATTQATDARAAAQLAAVWRHVRLLPLYAFRVFVLLPWGAAVFAVASLYQVTIEAFRDGRDAHRTPPEETVAVTMPFNSPREG